MRETGRRGCGGAVGAWPGGAACGVACAAFNACAKALSGTKTGAGVGVARRGFSMLEVLVSIAIVGVLVVVLLPMLTAARTSALATVCRNNLRQIGLAHRAYVDDFQALPVTPGRPEWTYGGAEFSGSLGRPVLAEDRPLNRYIREAAAAGGADGSGAAGGGAGRASGGAADRAVDIFRCPADRAWAGREGAAGPGGDAIGPPAESPARSFFERHGTSYLANASLLVAAWDAAEPAAAAGVSAQDVGVASSRLLLMGDPIWRSSGEQALGPRHADVQRLSWHGVTGGGNMLAVDGSVRFIVFRGREAAAYTFEPLPRPDR